MVFFWYLKNKISTFTLQKYFMKHICLILIISLFAINSKAQAEDPLPELKIFNKYCAKFALDEKPSVPADTNLIAIWKMKEDVDEHNYFVLERNDFYRFVFTYMNRGGSNRTYENVSMFFSKIGDVDFINVQYDNREAERAEFFFLKVTDLDSRGWDMTLSLVADSTLININSREALRERIAKNMNNPHYFKKPVHFRKKLPLMYCK